MANILVVDDELSIISVLKSFLKRGGHEVTVSSDGHEALNILKEEIFDLMLTDVQMPGINGLELLEKAKDIQSQLAVIVMTAYADVDNAVEVMKNGAFDYITKPFKFDELMVVIDKALSYEKALAENKLLKSSLTTKYHFNYLVGDSPPMLEVYNLIEKVSKTNSTILVLGDSGTGKELIAKAVHEASSRANGPFVPVNCTAMTETLLESELFGYVKGAFTGATSNKQGLFETANDGTIFLDEVGSIPLNMQMKLLRVLQEKEIRHVGGTQNISVDVRVIAATNEDLESKIKNGQFREDLYYRLSVIPVQIPPLCERKDDIPVLITHFLKHFNSENDRNVKISEDAILALSNHNWPGNVRELENLINRLATLCDNNQIELSDLPSSLQNPDTPASDASSTIQTRDSNFEVLTLKDYMRKIEKAYINQIIKKCDNSKEEAAKQLGISLATLYRKAGN